MHSEPDTIEKDQIAELRDRAVALSREIVAPGPMALVRALVVINLAVLFARPQHSLPFLQVTELPLILSVIVALSWLPVCLRNWTPQTKAMLGILALMTVWVPLARNNFWSFHTWRDLAQQFFCFIFPMVVYCCYGNQLKRLVLLFGLLGGYLGIYSILHKGFGPGGFLKDENDLCLTLVMFLPMALALAIERRSAASRFFYLVLAAVILAGIVATLSRGGFVGLILAAGFLLWRSQHKMLTSFLGFLFILGAAFFAPQQYWKEMSTIQETDAGTAKQRWELWEVGMRVWLAPKNFIAGVGQANVPYHLGDFEPMRNRTSAGRSISGRAVHSMYVQLVSELGLIGLLLFGYMLVKSYFGNVRARNELLRFQDHLAGVLRELQAVKVRQAGVLERIEQGESPEDIMHAELTLGDLEQVSQRAKSEARFFATLATATNASWLGALGAAAFISTLYYPPLWILAGFSAAMQLYLGRFRARIIPYIESSTAYLQQEKHRLQLVH